MFFVAPCYESSGPSSGRRPFPSRGPTVIEEQLRSLVREEVEAAVRETLAESTGPRDADRRPEDGSWRSRLWCVSGETRLGLSDVAEALDVSERSVRRYIDGNGDRPPLPHQRGPTGITITAGDLRQWIEDVEAGERFREGRP